MVRLPESGSVEIAATLSPVIPMLRMSSSAVSGSITRACRITTSYEPAARAAGRNGDAITAATATKVGKTSRRSCQMRSGSWNILAIERHS